MSSSCGVCTAPLSALGGDLAVCPSGDVFHESCIQKWIASRGQCCTCKQRFTQQQLVTLKLPHTDTAAIAQHRKQSTTAPSTPTKPTPHSPPPTRTTATLPSPPSPTLPPVGVPLTLAQVEELIVSYRRTALSYQLYRKSLQQKLSDKLGQLQLAYSRVVSDAAATATASHEDDDEALMHRHMLMAKLLACVHEAHLRDEEESVEEMARVVSRLQGQEVYNEAGQNVADVLYAMEQLMDEVDEQCWERIRPKQQQLADMEEEMKREEDEKKQWTQRSEALRRRRRQLESSIQWASRKRERSAFETTASTPIERITTAVTTPQQEPSPHASPLSVLMLTAASEEHDDIPKRHNSPPLSATSATSATASDSKRRKLLSLALQLSTDQFNALTDIDKLHLPRITILTHCPTIESFLSHQLHLRTIKRRWPDNEWRKINTTYTGQRKRRGLKGRGRGRQVLPATEEEQEVWRQVRKREIAVLMGGARVDGEGVGVGGMGMGGGESGSGSVEEDDDDDDRSEEDDNDGSNQKSVDSERSEMFKVELNLPKSSTAISP